MVQSWISTISTQKRWSSIWHKSIQLLFLEQTMLTSESVEARSETQTHGSRTNGRPKIQRVGRLKPKSPRKRKQREGIFRMLTRKRLWIWRRSSTLFFVLPHALWIQTWHAPIVQAVQENCLSIFGCQGSGQDYPWDRNCHRNLDLFGFRPLDSGAWSRIRRRILECFSDEASKIEDWAFLPSLHRRHR